MVRKTWIVLLFSIVLLSSYGSAQKNEIGVVFGTTLSPDSGGGTTFACPFNNPFCNLTVQTDAGTTYEGIFAHRLANLHLASIYLELPVVGTSDRNIRQGNFVQNFSSIFFTPSLRFKVSVPVISPFVSVGGGFAHFSPSTNGGTLPDQSSTQGAFQAGAGFDIGTPIPHLALRGEAREFFTGKPDFSPNRHNIFVGGGVVLHF